MKTVAILQARMNSTRLPGKMLLPLLGKPLVQHVIERVRRATTLDFVVLAYPLADNAAFRQVLCAFTNTPGVPLGSWAGQGDESDLIERYLGAAQAYDAEVIVRIPCDNPCVDPDIIDQAVTDYLKVPCVWLSNTTELVDRQYVDGIGCEVFSRSRLHWLDRLTTGHTAWREHLHQCFLEGYRELDYENFGIFFNDETPDLRLDVNTQADYEFISGIYTHFGHNRFTAQQIVEYLHTKEDAHAPQERVQSESH